ncbi:unnamed protein product [Sympodiomycopsis kandeliae]
MASSTQSTPKRRRIGAADDSQQASPAARALSGLRSWLSPWRGSATRSAAFGNEADEEESNDPGAQENSVLDDQGGLYPALPSSSKIESTAEQAYPFTFTPPIAKQPDHSAVTANPFTPQDSMQQSIGSPLSQNYDLLARFFAEKAAAEAGRPIGSDGRLTEEEVRGCLDLIEQSGSSVHEVRRAYADNADDEGMDTFAHLPRSRTSRDVSVSRRTTARRSWLSPAPSLSRSQQGHRYDSDVQSDFSNNDINAGGDMSISPERNSYSYLAPLRAEGAVAGLSGSSTEPAALFAKSLTGRPSQSSHNPFLTGSTSMSNSLRNGTTAAAAKRRRRPLYLGPGMSSSSSSNATLNRRSVMTSNNSRPAASRQPAVSAIGLGKRQRVAEQDTTEERDTDDTMGEDVPPPVSSLGSGSPAPASSSTTRSFAPLRSSVRDAKQEKPKPSSPPPARQQTRAANAALSILADLDLPKPSPPRKSTKPKSTPQSSGSTSLSVLTEDTPSHADTSFRPDTILNPYQAAPGLQFGRTPTSSNGSSSKKSRSSEALEKEKAERRKSSRLRKSQVSRDDDSESTDADADVPPSEGLLQEIERTRPSSMRSSRSTKRDEVKSSNGSIEPPSTPHTKPSAVPSTTPIGPPPQSLNLKGTDKTAEARRRLEAMKKPTPSSSSSSSSSSDGKQDTLQIPSTPNAKPSASSNSTSPMSFHAHAPGKPSRLSIAYNANESPNSSSSIVGDDEDEEQEHVKSTTTFTFGQKSATTTSEGAKGFSFGSTTPSTKPAAEVSSKPFSFGSSTPASKPAAAAEPVSKPFSFGSSTSTSTSASKPSSLPTPTLSFKPAPLPVSSPSSKKSTGKDPQVEALEMEIGSLPTFELGSGLPKARLEDGLDRESMKSAMEVEVGQLPKGDITSQGQASSNAQPSSSGQGSASTLKVAPSNGFSFNTPSSSTTTTSAATSNAPSPAPDAATDGEQQQESSASSSGLLGAGQGEEGEETSFEVRAKFWKFASGSWVDVGVGIARVKSKSGNGGAGRRLLVRNASNGQVTINFSLFDGFKVTQTGSSLSFTGFDEAGKGLPMRCKVKTADSASEFAAALEQRL